MRMKFLIAFLLLFTINITISAKTYNVPQYDETIQNPGSGQGLSSPTTKFDLFSNDETDETNYALTKIINIEVGASKSFVLDFFTIDWYAVYPSQELEISVSDNSVVEMDYKKDNVSSGTISTEGSIKTIVDTELPDRLIGSTLNSTFPSLQLDLNGLKEGLTKLSITVNSTFQYGVKNRSETLAILINVSSNKIIDIPNYINVYLGSGIHSGANYIKIENTENIGILTDYVSSISVAIPDEVSTFNDSSSNKIMYRILTDSKINVADNVLSFNDVSFLSTFTIEYYVSDNSGEQFEIASYSFTCIFYSKSDITFLYDNNKIQEDTLFEIGKSIKVRTTDALKPYIKDLIVVTTQEDEVLPYENESLYVFNKLENVATINFSDKLLSQSGLEHYSFFDPLLTLNLSPNNVIEKVYPSTIDLENEYYYQITNSLYEILEIQNINEFSSATTFKVLSEGLISASFNEQKQLVIKYQDDINIEYTITNRITIEATLDNDTTLVKQIIVYLLPQEGYKYTFDTLNIKLNVGEKQTIILGKLDPTFTEVKEEISVMYYLKKGNVIVNMNDTFINHFDIVGYQEGTDVIYFMVNEQMIEINVEISKPNENKTVNFSFLEGSSISILVTKDKSEINIPEEYLTLNFNIIVFDENIIKVESIVDGKITIKGINDGITQIFAYAQKDNIIYNAFITVKIITEVPSVNIVYDKEDNLTALTKFDNISISFNADDFDFSKNTIYTWYLNGEMLYENTKSFERKFNEGLNTLKLVINDKDNNITIETSQEIMISAVENERKTIAINTDDIIYIDKNLGSFEIEVLLDGVINPNYKYLWSISDTSVCKIDINGNETIVVEPKAVGSTDLTVMTNISEYEEVFIKADIKIEVMEPAYSIDNNNFIKPGTTQRFKILGDNKKIYNLKSNININCDGETFTDYKIEDNEIVIENIHRGNYAMTIDINGNKIEKRFEATNFNFKEMASVTLPYLIVICLIVIFVSAALHKRKGKLERTSKKIQKLQLEIDKILAGNSFTKKEVHEILHQTMIVKKMLTYCIDEGIDELSTLLPNVDKLIKILIATINSNIDQEKIHIIITNIKNRNIDAIIKGFKIVQDERTEFEAKKKVIDEVVKKNKKIKITKEEYETYLLQSKYMDGDEE